LYPDIITSDVADGIAEYTIDARDLPFKNDELKAIVMTHVLHHIPEIEKFFTEALRTLKPGGIISIVDVAHTPFARFFFKHFHPEPYDDSSVSWNFQQKNSMLDANQALTWMIFKRDQKKFLELYPDFVIEEFEYLPWFSYLISGGVTKKNIIPKTSEVIQELRTKHIHS
jgi:ubiquinone/menaquinone biosynthesis C-methylase UbiE